MTFSLEILRLATQPTNIISSPRRFLEARNRIVAEGYDVFCLVVWENSVTASGFIVFFFRPLLISSSFNEQLVLLHLASIIVLIFLF